MTTTRKVSSRHPEGLVCEARSILDRALTLYRPARVYALFSGGHDSLCSAHVVGARPEFSGCVHINTGIGIGRTRQFVRETCAAFGWPLTELCPPPFAPTAGKRRPGIDYENLPAYDALVLHHGFPGPAGHRLVYNRIKERCLRHLRRLTFGPRRQSGQVMLLVGGMRKAESVRRMGNAEEMSLEASEGRAWCSPLVYWTDEEKAWYMQANCLPRNPVVERLCMSGECCCGCFCKPEERAEIAHAYPDVMARIEALEDKARTRGVHAVWGTRPPNDPANDPVQPDIPGLCWSCSAREASRTCP